MTEVSFGEWLKRQRNSRGVTQEQLAHQIGCATITLRKIESEERRPSTAIVEQLSKIFEIPQEQKINFLKFARGDWTKTPTAGLDENPWQSSKFPRTNLPASVTQLIGRERSLVEIHDYLLQMAIRLVTLIGPPGIGKTRLSIEVARQCLSDFADGVFFVGLATFDDPNLIAATARQALGYVENQKISVEQHLMESIGEKQMLLVLDNCEHLVDDAALFASRLLSACSNLKILTTSREALHIPGEWLYTVPSLELPGEKSKADINYVSQYPALTLFAERARSVRSDFAITTENIQTISAICAELDGLPLAIELVAAQMRLHSPQSLLQRLNDQFILSVQGTRAVPSRQITLSHAISWSFDSLTPDEQRLFAYLSVFSGGFALSAAETIFSELFTEKIVSDLIVSLFDKSLLQKSTDSNSEPRFRMLVTIHYFAADHLKQINHAERVRDRHLAYFLELAERANAEIHGFDQLRWMDQLESELDNFRVALEWCVSEQNAELALRLLDALKWTWSWRGYFSEIENWFNKIQQMSNAKEYPAQYASLLDQIGNDWLQWDVNLGESLLRESHNIWLELGGDGEHGLARVLDSLGYLALFGKKDFDNARSFYEQSLMLFQKHADDGEIAWLTFRLGELASFAGRYAEAEEKFSASLAMFQKTGDKARAAYVLSGLGELARDTGEYEQAEIYWEQNLELFQELHVPQALAYPYHALACVSFRLGKYEKAKKLFREGLELFVERRDKNGIANCLAGLAGILGINGKPESSARLLGAVELLIESSLPFEPADQQDFDNYVLIARKQLDGGMFEKAWGEGRTMTMEQAIQYAFSKLDG